MLRNELGGPEAAIDRYFPTNTNGGEIVVADLPHMARPVVEYLHDLQPDVVIAGDRGGRLFGLSTMQSWRQRYPDEPFPTLDSKIHFSRVTSRSADEGNVTRALHYALENAGISRKWMQESEQRGHVPKAVFLDDWAVEGGTAERFLDGADSHGLSIAGLSYVTMCGKEVDTLDHLVVDPSRDPRFAEWDYSQNEGMAGVRFDTMDGVTPVSALDPMARAARRRLSEYTNSYYAKYTTALNAGEIAACNCVDLTEPALTSA